MSENRTVDSSMNKPASPASSVSAGQHDSGVAQAEGRVNQVLATAGRALVSAAEKGDLWGVLWRFFRRMTLWLTIVNVIACVTLWIATRWIGERNITTAFLIFLPPAIWFLPSIPVLALGLIFHRKCFFVQIGLMLLMIWGWLGYGWSGGRGDDDAGRTEGELAVMTYNRGQHMNQSLQPFKIATRPDVLVFQDAPGRAAGFLNSPDYAEFGHAQNVGEYTLLSRFPILETTLVPASAPVRGARTARFVIDWSGQPISVYAVHLATPREVLSSYMRGAFLWGVLGVPGTPGAEKRRQYQTFWDGQIADAEAILAAVRADVNPCIVVGDFNSPQTGYIHRMLTKELVDAHEKAGRGFGFTFPGVTRNPLSLGGPWMRIDYVFHDRRWEAVNSITEKNRPSQHRATMATLRLSNSPAKP